jgi:hypothetical protein
MSPLPSPSLEERETPSLVFGTNIIKEATVVPLQFATASYIQDLLLLSLLGLF